MPPGRSYPAELTVLPLFPRLLLSAPYVVDWKAAFNLILHQPWENDPSIIGYIPG